MYVIAKKIVLLMILALFLAVGTLPAVFAEAPKPARTIVVTYFHTTMRCPTCHNIEEYAKEAVQCHFENELKSGAVTWRVINVEEPGNEHFVKDYQLYSKHLIVSEIKDGKEARWKDLKEIWTKVRDEAAFNEYVKTEVAAWLKD
jgi:hypothetical protein